MENNDVLNLNLENATHDYLNGNQPMCYLRLLKADASIDISSEILAGTRREVNFASGTYYVYRTVDGTNYSLIHVARSLNGTTKYYVHFVRPNLSDIFDPVNGGYRF